MLLGYNTNGTAHHALGDAISLLAAIGYESVALTIDHAALNPYDEHFHKQLRATKEQLESLNMRSVVETGARFLLNPRLRHEPTLVSSKAGGRPQRIEFLRHAIDIAAELESDCVSLWSGVVRDGAHPEEAMDRLVTGLKHVLDYAQRRGVRLGFEPEPGMLIDTTDRFGELLERLPGLSMTLDVGHLHCLGETPLSETIARWGDHLVNVHIEDMRRGQHEHLMFGEGEIDFGEVMAALHNIGYQGGVHVELSRHSHIATEAAQRAFEFLHPILSTRRE